MTSAIIISYFVPSLPLLRVFGVGAQVRSVFIFILFRSSCVFGVGAQVRSGPVFVPSFRLRSFVPLASVCVPPVPLVRSVCVCSSVCVPSVCVPCSLCTPPP